MLASLQRESWACSSLEWVGLGSGMGAPCPPCPPCRCGSGLLPVPPAQVALVRREHVTGSVERKRSGGYITLKYYQSVFIRLGVNNVKINQRLQMKFPPPPQQGAEDHPEIVLASFCLFDSYCLDSDYFWKQENCLLATQFPRIPQGTAMGGREEPWKPITPSPAPPAQGRRPAFPGHPENARAGKPRRILFRFKGRQSKIVRWMKSSAKDTRTLKPLLA